MRSCTWGCTTRRWETHRRCSNTSPLPRRNGLRRLEDTCTPLRRCTWGYCKGEGIRPSTTEEGIRIGISKVESPALENPKVESLNWTSRPFRVRRRSNLSFRLLDFPTQDFPLSKFFS